MNNQQKEDIRNQKILDAIFEHYWWNIRGFSYRCNNGESQEKEVLALAIEPFLKDELRKPQSKERIIFKKETSHAN